MTKIAIMYDYDKTLSYRDMQEYSLIPELGYEDTNVFWQEVSKLSEEKGIDRILAYMYRLLRKSEAVGRPIRKEDFEILGKDIVNYPGVDTWFDRINAIGKSLGLEVEHYIISSGMTEIIEGTSIAKYFKEIYACKYLYDENGVAKWPGLVVNYTTKMQYLFRINKQVLKVNEDKALNSYTEEKDRPIPFRRMIYVGDGLTDVPSMKQVKEMGGKSIAVYNAENPKSIQVANQLQNDKRANYVCEANYEEGKDMETLVTSIMKYIAASIDLEKMEGQK